MSNTAQTELVAARFLSAAVEPVVEPFYRDPNDKRIFLGWTGWFYMLAAINAWNLVWFFVGYFCSHISIIDISWGLMPLVPLTMMLVDLLINSGSDQLTASMIIAYVLIAIWGIRLAYHIAVRYHGPDRRYVELEKFDSRCPEPFRGFMIWFKIFLFQATVSLILTDCAIRIFEYSKPSDKIGGFEISGIIIWVIGFFFEVVGDYQLTQFLAKPDKVPGQVIDTGLWRITRHPNYFGESLLWYGIYLIACGGSVGPAGGYYTFFSPLMMHFMLRWFTGVLINEANQKRKPAFRVYMLETNIFVPWCYKKIEGQEREELMAKFAQEIEEEKKAEKGSMLFGLFKKEWRPMLFKGGPALEEDDEKAEQLKKEGGAPEIFKVGNDPEADANNKQEVELNVLSVNHSMKDVRTDQSFK